MSTIEALIPVVVPVTLALLKLVIPRLPKPVIPILAPLLGAGLEIIVHYAGQPGIGPVWGAVLGSAGVGLREIVDQLRKNVSQHKA